MIKSNQSIYYGSDAIVHISICEDEMVYQTAIKHAITRWMNASGHMDIELSFYQSSDELLDRLERKFEVDLLFIDIQIPGEVNGVELARKIREAHVDVTIVFCTNYSEYVYEGYMVNALRFLKKPIVEEDIFFCCNYVYNRLTLTNTNSLTVFSSGKRYTLRYAEIRYLEVKSHSIYISTTLDDAPLKINARLSDITPNLPAELFVLCHRSFVVNIAHIRVITRTECLLLNQKTIPVSRTYANDINKAYDRYRQGSEIRYGMDNI